MSALVTSRRGFLCKVAATSGVFMLGASVPISRAQPQLHEPLRVFPYHPDIFLKIDLDAANDTRVTLICKHLEMGQGVVTGLATLIAEELDVAWNQMKFELAEAALSPRFRDQLLPLPPYVNLVYLLQATGGSTSTREAWTQMRQVGAAARAMLIAEAAKQWSVPAAEINVKDGKIIHGAKQQPLAKFAKDAMRNQLLPTEIKLKERPDWRLIGASEPLRRLDSEDKTDGTAQFAFDYPRRDASLRDRVLTVVVCRPNKFGARVPSSFSAGETLASLRKKFGDVVVDVKSLPSGIAIYAKHTWAAIEARKALKIDWDYGEAEPRSTEDIFEEYRGLFAETPASAEPGSIWQAENVGNATAALAGAKEENTVHADFMFPFLAHAPMEPLNCTVEPTPEGVKISSGCQMQTVDKLIAARELFGLNVNNLVPDLHDLSTRKWMEGARNFFGNLLGSAENVLSAVQNKITINTMLAGGSFGRRGTLSSDLITEACHAAKAIGGRTAIHLVRTREDDIQGGFYRPMVMHRVRAALTPDHRSIAGWSHQLASKSIFTEVTSIDIVDDAIRKIYIEGGFDKSTVEGVKDTPYAIENFEVLQYKPRPTSVPVTWWRSVGNSHTAFVMETIMDELAVLSGKGPFQFRRDLLPQERDRAVLDRVYKESQWATWPKDKGRGHGVAFHFSFETRVAMVAEVILGDPDKGKVVKVDRIVAAVDVGTAVNPDIVKAQVEGAVGFALSSVLRNQITLRDGVVQQSNFDDYEPTRMREMPQVEVHIIESPENEPPRPPTGIGEPPVPVVAPAIGNAIADALVSWGRKREWLHTLPFNYTTPLPEA
jgi:isoquinoline 1-oxidoreductase beta subunit